MQIYSSSFLIYPENRMDILMRHIPDLPELYGIEVWIID